MHLVSYFQKAIIGVTLLLLEKELITSNKLFVTGYFQAVFGAHNHFKFYFRKFDSSNRNRPEVFILTKIRLNGAISFL